MPKSLTFHVQHVHYAQMYDALNNSSVEKVSPSKARENLAEIIGKVRFGKKRFVFSSRGKDIAAIVPIEDLVLLEKFEDNQDIKLARQALEEEGTVTFEDGLAKLALPQTRMGVQLKPNCSGKT